MDEVIQFTSSIFNLKSTGLIMSPVLYAALFSSGLELLSGGCGGSCELELEGSGGCSDVAGCSAEEELAGCSVDGGASEEEGALSELELDELSASFVEEDSTVLLDSGCGAEEVVLGKTCTFGTS